MFTSDADFAAFAHWLHDGSVKFSVDIHGWVFMTNHVHLLMTANHEGGISRFIQYLGRLYVRYFNYNYARTGTLFEGRFRSSLIQEEQYFLTCLRYIELNPIRAGMVKDPGDYRWSSYQMHGLGVHSKLLKPHQLYLALGSCTSSRQQEWRKLLGEVLDIELLAKIRHCTNSGLVLGTKTFSDQISQMRD